MKKLTFTLILLIFGIAYAQENVIVHCGETVICPKNGSCAMTGSSASYFSIGAKPSTSEGELTFNLLSSSINYDGFFHWGECSYSRDTISNGEPTHEVFNAFSDHAKYQAKPVNSSEWNSEMSCDPAKSDCGIELSTW